MDPLTAIGLLLEAANLANMLALQVQKGDKTPEEALEEWRYSKASWDAAKDTWDRTASGR